MPENPLFLMMALNPEASTLTQRLQVLHDRLLDTAPAVDRIACALYDEQEDTLKTFINSTRTGEALSAYEYRLSESLSLSALAASGEFRVLDNIEEAIKSNTAHSAWLKEQGFRSSFTVPIYDGGSLTGFVFFDSMRAAAFTAEVQRDLVLYTTMISMATIPPTIALITTPIAIGVCPHWRSHPTKFLHVLETMTEKIAT